MMIPQSLESRVRAMVEEIGYRKAAWFCRDKRSDTGIGYRSIFRWLHGEVEPHAGSLAMLEMGVSRWERARGATPGALPSGNVGALSERN
jgi:hypothetical protein